MATQGKQEAEGKRSQNPPRADSANARPQPHSVEIEQALLACCILEGGQESLTTCIEERIEAAHFYRPAHQVIYESLLTLYQAGKPVDELVLADQLRQSGRLEEIGGHGYLLEITSRIDTPIHLRYYLGTVRDTAILRGLIHTCTSTVEKAYTEQSQIDEFLSNVEEEIFKLSSARVSDSAVAVSESVDKAVQLIQRMVQNKGEITGIPSGFTDLDKLTTGFHGSEMVVVAARPSMGKTSIGLNMVESVVLTKPGHEPVPTLMFSLEMPADQLAMRLLCSHSRVNMTRLRDGFLDGKEKELADTAGRLKRAPLWIDDSSGLNILQVRAKARRLARKHKLGLVVIDYLQLIAGTDSSVNREQQIADISRGIKGMARELDVPVIVLAQLNRESEKEKRQPRMSDLRESGSIEQDADVVLLLSKPRDASDVEDTNSPAVKRDLIIAKQRNGPIGVISLTFHKSLTRFENYTPPRD